MFDFLKKDKKPKHTKKAVAEQKQVRTIVYEVEEIDATEEYEARLAALRENYEANVARVEGEYAMEPDLLAAALRKAKQDFDTSLELLNSEYEFEDEEPAAEPAPVQVAVADAAEAEQATAAEAVPADAVAQAEPVVAEAAAEAPAGVEPVAETPAEEAGEPAAQAAVAPAEAPEAGAEAALDAEDDDIDYAEEYEQRKAALFEQFRQTMTRLQKFSGKNPAVFAAGVKKAKADYRAALDALDDEYEFEDEEPAPAPKKKDDNPLSYDKVQAATDDLNAIAREGIATARELKETTDAIKELFDVKDMFKL